MQQAPDRARTHAPPVRRQRRRQLRATLTRPAQRRRRITPRQRIHQALQRRGQPRLVLLHIRAAGPGPANAPGRGAVAHGQLAPALPDRFGRQPCRGRHQRVTAIPDGDRLGRRPEATGALIEHRRHHHELRDDRGLEILVARHTRVRSHHTCTRKIILAGALEDDVMTREAVTTVATPVASRSRFFLLMSVACLVVALIGFSPTFFFPLIRGTFARAPVAYVHAILFLGWLIFFIAQASLIRERNVSLHRRLGWLGAALAIAIVIVGVPASLDSLHRGLAARGEDARVLREFVGNLLSFLIFGAFVGAALVLRRDTATHKRLLLLATIYILLPAWIRFALFVPAGVRNPVVFTAIAYIPLLVAIAHDFLTHKRVHPVYVWVGCLFIAQDVSFLFGPESAWLRVAHWLLG